jgi:hypothetical protein
VSRKAEKYFEKLKQRNFFGWHAHELQTLYLGYGYKMIRGSKHNIFIHNEFSHVAELRRTLPRHAQELGPGYARKALSAIQLVLELRERGNRENE